MKDKDRFDNFCGGLHEAVESFDGFDEEHNSLIVISTNVNTDRDNSFSRGNKEMAVFSLAMRMSLDEEFRDVVKKAYSVYKKWQNDYENELRDKINRLQHGRLD